MIDYSAILTRKYPDSQWTLNGDDYAGLNWQSESAKPSKATLDGLWSEVQAEIASEEANKEALKASILTKLGITADELKAIL
jgi:hypothetical protein